MPESLRVLSISHPLRHPQVDNHTLFNAPTLFDYDAILIDPGRVFDSIIEVVDSTEAHTTHSDVPVVNGETTALATGLADLLRRRRDELARALERGAVVALFTYPQATIPQVSGFTGLDRYFYLPAPSGLGWDSDLIRGGEGPEAAIADLGHPFVPLIDALRPDILYRAYFNDRVPGFAAHARVIARSAGGAPVAVAFEAGGGTVVFLPAIRTVGGGERSLELATVLVHAMGAALGRAHDAPPAWLSAVPLTGIEERERAVQRARASLESARLAVDETAHAYAELASLRDMLWVEGDRTLVPAVARCLALLGFGVELDFTRLRAPEGELLLEASGSDWPVGMAPHYRLRARLDEVIASERRAPRGLVVANGQRLTAPVERTEEYDESLRIAAEATGYALITSRELFAAASAALDGRLDAPTAEAIRVRLLRTDGLVQLDDLLEAPATAEDAASS